MNKPRIAPSSKLLRQSVLGAACVLLVAACSSGDEPWQPADELPELGETQLQLVRAASCDDLLTRIQDSIIVQLTLRAEQLKSGEQAYSGPGIEVDAIGAPPPRAEEPQVGAPTVTPDAAPAPQDPAVPSGEGTAGNDVDNGGGFSGTTLQVKDVDEADIVKADGDRIYLLHGGTLFVLQGWPANASQILGSVPVEGQPAEMFVSDGKAVVFSRVYRDIARETLGASAAPAADWGYYYDTSYTKISVLDVTGPTPSVLRESFVEGDYSSSRRHDEVVRAVIQDGFKIPPLDSPSIQYRDPFGQPFPQVDIDTQVEAWLERTVRSVRATGLDAWLPREFAVQQSGAISAVAPRCADYYSPDPRLTESGVTSVVSLDLGDVSAPFAGATILGRAERVYSNESALLITQTDYRYTFDAESSEQTIIHRFDIGGNTTTYTASGAVAGSINNQFSLDERDGVIRVSTTEQPFGRFGVGMTAIDIAQPAPGVPADPGTNPAPDAPATEPSEGGGEADEADPELSSGAAAEPDMVAPDLEPTPVPVPAPMPAPVPQGPVSVSRVVTLGTDGNTLKVLGSTEDFGQTERIFATRFIGDRAYVVTFRQTDPLFVIDLADPTDPHVVGELHIPGFSNYLFPLDENHLFAIGRDATAGGVVQGLALQVFDVSDPTSPALSAKFVFEDQGDSPANVDHRAISFHPDRNVVAFPHQSYIDGSSTLELFQLENTRITRLGGIGLGDEVDFDVCLAKYFGYPVGSAELEQLRVQVAADEFWQRDVLVSCRYGSSFRRGLFRDDFVYGISNTGVYVYDMTAMSDGAVSEVSLPAEVYVSSGGGVAPALPTRQPPPDVPASNGGGASDGAGADGSPGSDAP